MKRWSNEKDKVVEIVKASPKITIRGLAKQVGCSVTAAHTWRTKARQIIASELQPPEKPTLLDLIRSCGDDAELGMIIARGLSGLMQKNTELEQSLASQNRIVDQLGRELDITQQELRKAGTERDRAKMEYGKLLQRHNEMMKEQNKKQLTSRLPGLKKLINEGRTNEQG